MAKNDLKVAPTVETMKPYLDRALNDAEFRADLKEALGAARKLYGPIAKENGGIAKGASKLATDAKVQESLRKALEDFGKAAGSLKGKKKGHKGRKAMLLAGLVAGALYNPWSGPQTREWLLDKVAGDDDLQPLDGFDLPGTDEAENGASATANGAAEAVADAVEAVDDSLGEPACSADRPPVGLFGARPERVASRAPGTSPLVPEMSSASSRTAPAGGAIPARAEARPVERQVRTPGVERDVLGAAPGVQERVRGHGAVVALREERDGVDLEMEVHG